VFKEFRDFIMRGSVVDLAVGIIIGAAFTSIVNSLVNDIIMPPIGYITGGVDFSNLYINLSSETYASLAAAQEAGAPTINIGLFINSLINFLIIAFCVFLLVRAVNRIMEFGKKEEESVAEEAPTEPSAEEKLTAAIEKLTVVMESQSGKSGS